MKGNVRHPFQQVLPTVRGHFILNLYAAVYLLLQYIRWLEQYGGVSLEELCQRYPFLAHYQFQLRIHMPEKLSAEAGYSWWREQIQAWERNCETFLPLQCLTGADSADFSKRMILVLCGLVDEDSRFGTLLATLQAPLPSRYFTLELLSNIFCSHAQSGISDRLDCAEVCRGLVNEGFVACPNPEAARSEWLLQIPAAVWDVIRSGPQAELGAHYRYQAASEFKPLQELIYPETFRQQLQRLPGLFAKGQNKFILVRSDPGSDRIEVIGALAKALYRGVILVSLEASRADKLPRSLGALCVLTQSMPVLQYELGPGETVAAPVIPVWSGAVAMSLGYEGGVDGEHIAHSINLSLPLLDRELRRRYWSRELGAGNAAIEAISDHFHISGKYIQQMASMAASIAQFEGDAQVDLRHACKVARSLNRQTLENLADPLQVVGSWRNLVCNPSTGCKLIALQQRCQYRERLMGHLGAAFEGNVNRGVRALFTGVSGTGKTMAAKILAAELQMDLYRVDLAAVINKYIGETEKNLHKILSSAEALDIVLLLDEGDALLGGRTDVKSANDRYANLETNYLLQRLENYQGIIIVTTNLSENIDRAFQRRMDVVVPFYAPQADERWRIMQLHLPETHQISEDLLHGIARQCVMTGGQIRNAVMNAALTALHEDSRLQDHHLINALQGEYQKAGGIFPLHRSGRASAEQVNAMEGLISVLQDLR